MTDDEGKGEGQDSDPFDETPAPGTADTPQPDDMEFAELLGCPGEPARNPSFPRLTDVRKREWLALLGLTVTLDFLLYQGAGGLSWGLCLGIVPLVVLLCARRRRFSLGLFVVTLCMGLLAFRCVWQVNPFVLALGVIALVFFAIALRSGRAGLPFLMVSFVPALAWGFPRLVQYVGSVRIKRLPLSGKEVNPALAKTIGIPVVITAAFAMLFLLANTIVRRMAGNAWRSFFEFLDSHLFPLFEQFTPSMARLLFWVVCLSFVAALLRPRREALPGEKALDTPTDADLSKDTVHFQASLNTLIAVNLLFLAYNAFDARYLVGEVSLPPGLDHSQYARQGTFWLTVALVLSTLVLGAIFRTSLRHHGRGKFLYRLAGLWCLQNFVLSLWVFRRLWIYIGYNGLTRMRIVGVFGIVLVIIGFVLVVMKVKRDHSALWLIRRQLAAFCLALVLLAVSPLDLVVWRVNVPLMLRDSQSRAAVQLAVQPISPEGLPALLPLLAHEEPIIAQGAAAILGEWYFETRTREGQAIERWTQYQVTRDTAERAIGEREAEILALTPDKDWEHYRGVLKHHTARWI
jgi:Domain of unknown function (DUF4153)